MRQKTKLVHEGEYVVAVQVNLIEPAPGWEACLPLADAIKLEETRAALRSGDLTAAATHGTLYHLTPLIA